MCLFMVHVLSPSAFYELVIFSYSDWLEFKVRDLFLMVSKKRYIDWAVVEC